MLRRLEQLLDAVQTEAPEPCDDTFVHSLQRMVQWIDLLPLRRAPSTTRVCGPPPSASALGGAALFGRTPFGRTPFGRTPFGRMPFGRTTLVVHVTKMEGPFFNICTPKK